MARLWNGTNGHRLRIGTPAVIQDLMTTGHTLVMQSVTRRADAANIGLSAKEIATITNGWRFMMSQDGSTYGVLRAVIGTGSTGNRFDRWAPATPNVLDQPEVVSFTFDAASAAVTGIKLFRSAFNAKIAEVASYATLNTGSGSPAGEGATNCDLGNINDTVPANADLGFWLIYNRATAYTLAEQHTLQLGMIQYLAGEITRAEATWKSVSGYKLLNYLAADGTSTDYSGNGITGTLTGTASGADSPNWYAPASGDFDDDLEVGESWADQVTYPYTSDFARKRYITAATSFTAWMVTTRDPASAANLAVLGYDIDNVWTGKLTPPSLGIHTAAVTGLSGSSKTVAFVNGQRSKPLLASVHPYEGTFLAAVQFGASATPQAAASRASQLVVVGDSALMSGSNADSPQRYAAFQVLRRALPGWLDGVVSWSAGGLAWYDIASDSTKRAATVATLTTDPPRAIGISLMANDKGRDAWATATAATAIGTLLDNLLAAFSGPIYLFDLTITTDESGTNSFGETWPNWRAMLATLGTGRPRVTFVPMISVLTTGDLADTVHPSTAGHQALGTFIADLFAGEPHDITGAVSVSVSVAGAMDFTRNTSIAGAVTTTFAVAGAMDFTRNAAIAGAVTVSVTPSAALDYTRNAALVGSVTVALTPSATLAFNRHASIAGATTTTVTPSAAMQYTAAGTAGEITGDVAVSLTPSATLAFNRHAAIVGSTTFSAIPSASLDYTRNAAITGGVTVTFGVVGSMAYTATAAVVVSKYYAEHASAYADVKEAGV